MFGCQHVEAQPSSCLVQRRSGRVVREGFGSSRYYHRPLAAVLVESRDEPFIVEMVADRVGCVSQDPRRLLERVLAITEVLLHHAAPEGRDRQRRYPE